MHVMIPNDRTASNCIRPSNLKKKKKNNIACMNFFSGKTIKADPGKLLKDGHKTLAKVVHGTEKIMDYLSLELPNNGGSLLNRAINGMGISLNIPSYVYCGPGTKIELHEFKKFQCRGILKNNII